MQLGASVLLIRMCSQSYDVLPARGDAGTYPSHQRCCAASASHSGETQGDASPPPVPTSPAPTRLFYYGSHISMIMSVCCHVLYNKRICITWQVLTKIILRRL